MALTCPSCGTAIETKPDCPCPNSGSCSMVRCSSCHTEFPDPASSVLARWLGKLFSKSCENKEGSAVPLSRLLPGKLGSIEALEVTRQNRLNELASLGLLPGAVVEVRQLKPTVILQLGETTLALDDDVASEILVRPLS